jgi:IclR family KDG regulon transcriptional repressor
MNSQNEDAGSTRYHIRAVERALSILKLFIANGSELSAAEISAHLNLHRSTTFRFLVTLMDSGFIEQNPQNHKYHLGIATFELGNAFLKQTNLHERAKSVLESLRDQSGETVHLAILEENEVVYLEKLAGLHPIGLMSSRVGSRSPAYCTGLGKALLAYSREEEIQQVIQNTKMTVFTENTITNRQELLDEFSRIRAQGYAVDQEEHEHGVMCVAAPVFDSTGVVAAISAAGPAARMDRKMKEENLELLVKEAAASISMRLGGSPDRGL